MIVLKVNEINAKALGDVLLERERQEQLWGVQNHDPFTYLTILMEEVGELSQAALHTRYGGLECGRMREEAIQVAAVALAIVECLGRDEWEWPIVKENKDDANI